MTDTGLPKDLEIVTWTAADADAEGVSCLAVYIAQLPCVSCELVSLRARSEPPACCFPYPYNFLMQQMKLDQGELGLLVF